MLSYELGDPRRPRGHALVFFHDLNAADRVVASYVVIPPIQMDFAKYVPPMFAGQFDQLMAQGPSAFPLPPIPEEVPSLEHLRTLASARDDDLIDGGLLDTRDVARAMSTLGDIAGEYTAAHTSYAADLPESFGDRDQLSSESTLDPDDILLDILTDSEKVSRLAKLTGTLRYAVEGGDEQLTQETTETMRKVGQRMPTHYRVDELLAAADRLVNLYVERCYSLAREDLGGLQELDTRIESLRSELTED
jgi:hypothetical protein